MYMSQDNSIFSIIPSCHLGLGQGFTVRCVWFCFRKGAPPKKYLATPSNTWSHCPGLMGPGRGAAMHLVLTNVYSGAIRPTPRGTEGEVVCHAVLEIKQGLKHATYTHQHLFSLMPSSTFMQELDFPSGPRDSAFPAWARLPQ